MLKIYLLEKVSWKVMTRQMVCRMKKGVQGRHHDNPGHLLLAKPGTAHPQVLVLALAVELPLVIQEDIDHALVRVLDPTLAHRLHAIEAERIGIDLLQTLALDHGLVLTSGQEDTIHLPAHVPEDDRSFIIKNHLIKADMGCSLAKIDRLYFLTSL
jgi:hypothetical protein